MLNTCSKRTQKLSSGIAAKLRKCRTLAAGFLVLGACLALPSKALATTHYISPVGPNTGGTSWQTAWSDFNKINWSTIQAGDTIQVWPATYHTQLIIPATAPSVSIQRAQVGVNSPIILQAPTTGAPSNFAVQILSPAAITITGVGPHGFQVSGFTNGGVEVIRPSGSTPQPVNLQWMDVNTTGTGGYSLYVMGPSVNVSNSVFHDNAYGAYYADNGASGTTTFTQCWFYNTNYSTTGRCTGITHQQNYPTYANAQPLQIKQCLLGPGLDYSLNDNTTSNTSMTDCLIINPTTFSLALTSKSFKAIALTSVLLAGSPAGNTHWCFDHAGSFGAAENDSISGAVFYGGAVYADPSITCSKSGTFQYNTTGNTTFLSGAEINPIFNTNFAAMPNNTPISTLMTTDFSLSTGSPFYGDGSSITSVSNFISRFLPQTSP